MVGAPTVQSADTDGNGPRRRRRPALSCVECRLRKVKCDREKPCGGCRRLESSTCSYRSQRAATHSTKETPHYPTPTSTSGSTGPSQESGAPSQPSSIKAVPSNEFDLIVNRYIGPGVLGEHGGPTIKPLCATGRSDVNTDSCSDLDQAVVIKILLDRIRALERAQISSTEDVRSGRDTLSSQINQPASSSGQFLKSKFFGRSHWMNAIDPYEALGDKSTLRQHLNGATEPDHSTALYHTVFGMKRMTRIIKASRMLPASLPPEIQESVPPRDVCDALVECYLRTFENSFRVLHVPTFRRECEKYWTQPIPVNPSVLLRLLLVCAIGTPFYIGPNQTQLRHSAEKWIRAATDWLSGPNVKSRLTVTGLQIQILELLARQVCNIDGDHTFIPAGSLLRRAMHLGMHRDPSHFSRISVFHGEMHRRLWATVLEITVQSSLDMGMPPMISIDDYDTTSPANINDEDIGEELEAPLDIKPLDTFTDSSVQIRFAQSLPIRLEIIRLINSLRFELSYTEVLQLGTKLTNLCQENSEFLLSALATGCKVFPFQIKLLDTLVRRFVLCLHRPYYTRATEEPQYCYSRKICLDSALTICAPATEQEDDWTRMGHRCTGWFKSYTLYALSTIYFELNSQIKEQKEGSALFAPLVSKPQSSSSPPIQISAQFRALRGIIESARDVGLVRIRHGETNAKGVAFITCALARIDALVSGADPDAAVLEAARAVARETNELMLQTYREEYGEDININQGRDPSTAAAPGPVRENAPTATAEDYDINELLPSLNSQSTSQANALNDGLGLENLGAQMDLDFNAYLAGQNFEPDFMYDFTGSSEWGFDLNGWAGL